MLSLRDRRYESIKLTFQEDGHKYTDSLGNSLISVTTLLHEYRPQFDRKYWVRRKAKELGISEAQLSRQWKEISEEACNRGTMTHEGLEDGIKGASMFHRAVRYMSRKNGEMITVADIPLIDSEIRKLDIREFMDSTGNKYPKIYEVLQYYVDKGYNIYSEIGAFLIDYLVSGTIDVLCVNEKMFTILDWKTNRGGLQFEAGYYKKDKSQRPNQLTDRWVPKNDRLLPPVAHMPDCNGSIYNLQLSMYAFMVEQVLGIPNAGIALCHIDSDFVLNEYGMPKRFPDGLYHVKENPVEKVTWYKMKYLKKEVMDILRDRRSVVEADIVRNRGLFEE